MSTVATGRPVLVVEDTDADYEALVRAFAAVNPVQILARARSAEEAMTRLRDPASGPLPVLVLVDLNLPRNSGLDFLAELSSDPHLGVLPAVVFSSSTDPRDVRASYAVGASGFMVKPFDLGELNRAVGVLWQYWAEVMTVPGECDLRSHAAVP